MRAGRPRAARSRRIAARAAVRPGPIHQRGGRPLHPSRRELRPPPSGLDRMAGPPGSERGSPGCRRHGAERALPPTARHTPRQGAAPAKRAPPDGWPTGQRGRALTRPLPPRGARARSRAAAGGTRGVATRVPAVPAERCGASTRQQLLTILMRLHHLSDGAYKGKSKSFLLQAPLLLVATPCVVSNFHTISCKIKGHILKFLSEI